MTNQTHNDLSLFSNNNVIKIPYSDNQEEPFIETSFHINGFTIIELDEDKNDFTNLILSDEEDQNIGKKQKLQLKSKAKNVENYYSVYQDEIVPNTNCSRCLLSNYTSNDLLYFKDKKALIQYLKYCFTYKKKSIFMNYFFYKKNKNELSKINQSFYSGWKFLIPKTICKACFMQLINKEYFISNIKNIIRDYDETNILIQSSKEKIPNFINSKRRRVLSKNRRKKTVNVIKDIHFNDKRNDINTQLEPIVIPILDNEIVPKAKRRRSSNIVFKKRKKKNMQKIIKKKYNENIIFDAKNNTLIINKKSLGNYQFDEDSLIVDKIINNNKKDKKSIINKEKDNKKHTSKKKNEKLKFISSNKNELDSINKNNSEKEIKIDNKFVENKDIKVNNNNSNLNSIPINIDKNNNTIIINNFNNNKSDEINMNKVGLIQINNNQFENKTFHNYVNNDFDIKNNLNQNSSILINNLNNNNNYSNFYNYTNISTLQQILIKQFEIPTRLNQDLIKLQSWLKLLIIFTLKMEQDILNNNLGNKNLYMNSLYLDLLTIDEIHDSFTNNVLYMEQIINIIKYNIRLFPNIYNNSKNNELFSEIVNLEEQAKLIKYNYDDIMRTILNICKMMRQVIEKII